MTATRLFREQLRLDDDVAAFEAFAEKQWRAQSALDLAILPDEGVARTTPRHAGALERTGTVMLTSRVEHARRAPRAPHGPAARRAGRADGLVQSLTSGIRDLESARPGMGIMHVAALARREPEACAVIERESTTGFDAIPEGPTRRALAELPRALRRSRRARGRAVDAALEGGPAPRPAECSARRCDGRASASRGRSRARKAQADAEMAQLVPMLNVVEQTLIRHLVVRAQRAARLRERMRAWVTRVLGMLREAALDADRRLLRRDPELASDWRALVDAGSPLASVRSVFFLTIDEVVERAPRIAHRHRAARSRAPWGVRARSGASRSAGDVRRRCRLRW